MATKNRLILIASATAVLLGAGVLGVTALRAASPSESADRAESSKKKKAERAQRTAERRSAPSPTACADPANDECAEADDQRLAGIEAHKERWLKKHYPVEIANDPNTGSETAAAPQQELTPEEQNARLAEGQKRIVELFPEIKDQVDKMNSDIAAERKLVDETGMTQQERAMYEHMHQ